MFASEDANKMFPFPTERFTSVAAEQQQLVVINVPAGVRVVQSNQPQPGTRTYRLANASLYRGRAVRGGMDANQQMHCGS